MTPLARLFWVAVVAAAGVGTALLFPRDRTSPPFSTTTPPPSEPSPPQFARNVATPQRVVGPTATVAAPTELPSSISLAPAPIPPTIGEPITRLGRTTPVPAAPPAEPALDSPPRQHKIVDGDSLTTLAAKYLGTTARAREIFDLNRDILPTPETLPVGANLRLPGEQTPAPTPDTPPPREFHVLKPGPLTPPPRKPGS